MACTHPEIESTEIQIRKSSLQSNHSVLTPHSAPDDYNLQQSSSSTIFGIMNTLSGSPILLLPVLFKTCGIFTCMIILIIIGYIQFLTCSLYLDHQKESERRLERTIRRILGQNWLKVYNISSGVFMFIVGVIYYQLINISLYFLITSIKEFCYPRQDKNVENINYYSQQLQALILILPLSLLISKKDISQIIGLSKYGVISLFAYVCYLIYLFIDKVFFDINFEQQKNELLWFSYNFSEPAGNFALGFMVHNCIGMLVENKPDKQNNKTLTGIAYFLVIIIYCCIGILGSVGLLGRSSLKNDGHTIMEYFDHQDIAANIINFLILIKLISVFPLVHYFSKNQILNTLYPNKSYPTWTILFFSGSFILGSVIICFMEISVTIVIGIDGAIVGFLIIYIIPILMHFQCHYGKKKNKLLNGIIVNCVNHKKDNRFSFIQRFLLYTIILLIGICNMFLQLYYLL